jgi:hypothetical protein
MFGLKEMLQRVMDQFKVDRVGTPPSIQPEPPLIPQTSIPQREMYALGGILSKMSRKLLAKHRKDNVVKVLKKEVDKADKKLKEATEEFDIARDEFYEDGTMEGHDFDAGGSGTEILQEIQNDRQKLAFQLERRLYDLEKKENPDVEYFVKERDFMEDIDPEERSPGYIDRLDREMDPNNPDNYNNWMDDDIPFSTGGRVGYAVGGGLASRFVRKLIRKHKDNPDVKKLEKKISKEEDKLYKLEDKMKKQQDDALEYGEEVGFDDPINQEVYETSRQEIFILEDELEEKLLELEGVSLYEPEPREMPGGEYMPRRPKQEGGELDAQMADMMSSEEIEATQLPDEAMEEDYVEFIMSEALEPEEQQYLTDRLVEDDQLSIIFDKVVETASEFSGAGSVEGPGTGISDSIPARLSDGEFVMTAKATDAIGADTLDELMALAEQEADTGRQAKAIGGEAQSDIEKVPSTVIEDDPIKLKNKEAMRALDPRLSLFAS